MGWGARGKGCECGETRLGAIRGWGDCVFGGRNLYCTKEIRRRGRGSNDDGNDEAAHVEDAWAVFA